jgi:hypothetical protein
MTRRVSLRVVGILAAALALPVATRAQGATYALESTTGLRLHNVTAEPVTFEGKNGLRVTESPELLRRLQGLPAAQQAQFETLAIIEGSDFSNGVIEAEIAGSPKADAAVTGARGFVGIAFRLRDTTRYDAFYLRPTNGRAGDQLRRNHSVQYISHPDWPWPRLRGETPERYESYVDLQPGVWTRIRIEVRADTARLYVHGQQQPTLIVNDVKSGAQARGAIALWIGPGTVGHFRDLRVTR